MKEDELKHGPCPIQWGDRVDHKMFGFGTVVGEPVPVVGGSLEGPPFIVPSGWRITVNWDDPTRPQSDTSFDPDRSNVLQKVSSPTALGHAYWENEWRKRLDVLLVARGATDGYLKDAFRKKPSFSSRTLAELRDHESHALAELEDFLAADERGEHA